MTLLKSRGGVSTIIATILMVAITVVLAGVLYVMILTLGGSDSTIAPLGSWSEVRPAGNDTVVLEFGSFNKDIRPIEIKLYLSSGSNTTIIVLPGSLSAQDSPASVSGYNASKINAIYTDFGWQSEYLGKGDYLTISGLDPGRRYEIIVFHEPTQSVVQMAGAASAFQLNN